MPSILFIDRDAFSRTSQRRRGSFQRCGRVYGGTRCRYVTIHLSVELELTTQCLRQKLLPQGSAVAPVIISTDKTQLTQFSGNKSAYPVYLTLGNIPRAIRRRPSEHACILLGYLPIASISKKDLTKREQRARKQRLFHAAMRVILDPLVEAGAKGIEVTSGDGTVRRVYPILATYVADYPEQCLVTCSKYGTCPKCQCPADMLQDASTGNPRTSEDTERILEDAYCRGDSSAATESLCMEQEVSGGTRKPFWKDLPFTDIHLSITPDVLHQLYQGVFKHLVSWCQDLLSPEELDNRLRCLPPAFGIRNFKNGISCLSQITGKERKDVARVLLGCLIGKIPKAVMVAFRSLMDFIYIAQYPNHDDTTLGYLRNALQEFHKHKHVLVNLGIREHFNIPKIHSLLHYVESIRQFGTTDNYNTEMFERLHIDFAKDAWRASNHQDEFPQMTRWISRREKITFYEIFQRQQPGEGLDNTVQSDEDEEPPDEQQAGVENGGGTIKIAKYPPAPQQHLARIQELHNAPGFTTALVHFLNDLQPPPLHLNRQELSRTWLPFARVDVYHKFQFNPVEISDGKAEVDTVKAIPASVQRKRSSRFDTVIVLENGEAESTGLQGEHQIPHLRPKRTH